MTNEGPNEEHYCKYCIQDCNLVHYLTNKIDVINFIEPNFSVPMEFLVMRGQGIKLTSYIAKNVSVLLPAIEKRKTQMKVMKVLLYCHQKQTYILISLLLVLIIVLYTSSMISENISHDSKVWTENMI